LPADSKIARVVMWLLGAAILVGVGLVALDFMSRRFVRREAILALHARHGASREADVTSREFVVMGLRRGDSTEQVDRVMEGWTKRSGPLVEPGTEGTHLSYAFDGHSYDGFLGGTSGPLTYEYYKVYFDPQNRAIAVRRHLFINQEGGYGEQYFELEERAAK
jgi:hypothetical protein